MTEFEAATKKSLVTAKKAVKVQMARFPVDRFPEQATALRVLDSRIQEAVKTVEKLSTLEWKV